MGLIWKHGASVAEMKTIADSTVQENIGLLYGTATQK